MVPIERGGFPRVDRSLVLAALLFALLLGLALRAAPRHLPWGEGLELGDVTGTTSARNTLVSGGSNYENVLKSWKSALLKNDGFCKSPGMQTDRSPPTHPGTADIV